jgi:hypothetical protein
MFLNVGPSVRLAGRAGALLSVPDHIGENPATRKGIKPGLL